MDKQKNEAKTILTENQRWTHITVKTKLKYKEHTQLVSSLTASLQTSRMAVRIERWAPTCTGFDAFSYNPLKTCNVLKWRNQTNDQECHKGYTKQMPAHQQKNSKSDKASVQHTLEKNKIKIKNIHIPSEKFNSPSELQLRQPHLDLHIWEWSQELQLQLPIKKIVQEIDQLMRIIIHTRSATHLIT